MSTLPLSTAISLFQTGQVLAYPTEAVFGLGCLPNYDAAIERILAIKSRPADKGLILVAHSLEILLPFLDWDAVPETQQQIILDTWPGPYTWLIPARASVSSLIRGKHLSVAVRVSNHPTVRALSIALEKPLISTSANKHGMPPLTRASDVAIQLGAEIDGIVEGEIGELKTPTQIRDGLTGEVIRP